MKNKEGSYEPSLRYYFFLAVFFFVVFLAAFFVAFFLAMNPSLGKLALMRIFVPTTRLVLRHQGSKSLHS